jgi:hypothetical protein
MNDESSQEDEFAERWERLSNDHYIKDTKHEKRGLLSLIEAVSLIEKIARENGITKFAYTYHAEHDILYLGPSFDSVPKISDNDIVRLCELGIHWDEQCFAAFC